MLHDKARRGPALQHTPSRAGLVKCTISVYLSLTRGDLLVPFELIRYAHYLLGASPTVSWSRMLNKHSSSNRLPTAHLCIHYVLHSRRPAPSVLGCSAETAPAREVLSQRTETAAKLFDWMGQQNTSGLQGIAISDTGSPTNQP